MDESVRVAVSRDAGLTRVEAVPGTHVVAISIDGGPDLILHPHTARDLLQAQDVVSSRGKSDLKPDEVLVPPTLRWREAPGEATAARSRIGDLVGGIVIKAVNVVRDVLTDAAKDAIKDKAAEVTARFFAKKVDDQVTEGVYALRPDVLDLKDRPPLTGVSASGGPLLVFVHGTFSSTAGGFGRLWTESPGRVANLFDTYPDRVFALDHATLCASPIRNAWSLASVLPRGTHLHLVTHSRGGLVAEALALACARRAVRDEELDAFIPEQRDELKALIEAVNTNDLHVDRIIRVGCPIRGTLLASKRLDAYLSVLKWTMDVAGWGIAGEVVDFLGAVAQQRLEADNLPGLAAQVPNSPLIEWLHADPWPIPGELRVVSGDVQGDSVLTWLKTLMADGFYWTDNDVVVQTRSMYGGLRRRGAATFCLDRGGKVLHTRYFAKDRVAESVFKAILDDQPNGFQTIGPLSWAGTDSSGVRGRRTSTVTPTTPGDRPVVFLVPGFGASTLASGNTVVWPAAMATATIDQLRVGAGAEALAAKEFVGDTFDALHERLEATHDVIRFPYDWRLPLEVAAKRLADDVATAMTTRTPHPVRLLTHGSGALLVRVLQLHHPQLWERLLTHPQSRVVMLAPPNDGTWMPMQVLSGDETFGGLLVTGAPPLGEPKVRDAFGTMPGLLQLQAGLIDDTLRLGDVKTWEQFAKADEDYERAEQRWHSLEEQRGQARWGRPSEDALGAAVALRRDLDQAARQLAPDHARRIAIVAGVGCATADGLPAAKPADPAGGASPFVYVDTTRGDGRVAATRTVLPGVTTYFVDAEHQVLPSLDAAIPAYVELLNKGTTSGLPRLGPARDQEDVRTTSRASRKSPPRVPANQRDILSSRRQAAVQPSEERRAIRISVIHGDLMFVGEPLMIGHYRSARLTGTESVMDRLVGGAMSRSLAIDVYPDRPSSYQVFKNTYVPWDDRIRVPRPAAVIVVGLGEEGTLTAADLVLTVRKGVLAWAEREAERTDAPPTFDLAATLIGSGGKGMDVAQVAPLIAEAVSDADALLDSVGLPRVGELKIVELFLDRATDAWHALTDAAKQAPHRYQIAPTIVTGSAPLRRVPGTHYRGADYDFVSIVSRGTAEGSELAYTVDGRRARTDVAHQVPQMPLLLQLLDASNASPAPPRLGQTLFNLLVPIELESFLGNSTDVVLELDDGTSGIPWEMLDTNSGSRGGDSMPWSIRSKIIRKLRVDLAGPVRTTATADDYVLVIGEPQCDPDRYLRLPGARREAAQVANTFKDRGPEVIRAIAEDDDEVPGPDSAEILDKLYQHPYRIIHIAGHGEPTITGTRDGGVVLSPFGPEKQETYLGPKEIQSIRIVPELVFVNCCHVGARERLQLLTSNDQCRHAYNRPQFAATLARKLIEIGVRCVIVAGWAVDDEAAKMFALTFYEEILNGRRFIDATATARKLTRAMGGTTWAAFQCWGDPEWRYLRHTSDAQGGEPEQVEPQHTDAASPDALLVTLETIAMRAEVDPPAESRDAQKKKERDAKTYVTTLEHQFGDTWGKMGRVAYAFGKAWVALGDRAKAADWYNAAINANDGTAPIKAAEQFANVRVRLAWDAVSTIKGGELSPEDQQRLATARAEIESQIASLQLIKGLRPTLEVGSLLGSAHKRLAMVAAKSGDEALERAACADMLAAYVAAESDGAKDGLDLFYPAWNRLVAEAIAVAEGADGSEWSAARVEQYRILLAHKREREEDFWSSVAEFELDMIEAVASGTLAAVVARLEKDFRHLAERVPTTWMWSSVRDNSTFVLDVYRRRLERERAADPGRQIGELDAIDRVLAVLGELAGKRAG